MLAAPRAREARRPSPLHTHGWLDTRVHVCLCMCVCAPASYRMGRLGALGFGTPATPSSGTAHAHLPAERWGRTGPALRGLRVCWGRQKLGKRARGRGPGTQPGWGPPHLAPTEGT